MANTSLSFCVHECKQKWKLLRYFKSHGLGSPIITKARLENTRLEEEGEEESSDNKCKKETQKQLSKLSDDVDDDNNQRDRSQRVLCPLLPLLFFPRLLLRLLPCHALTCCCCCCLCNASEKRHKNKIVVRCRMICLAARENENIIIILTESNILDVCQINNKNGKTEWNECFASSGLQHRRSERQNACVCVWNVFNVERMIWWLLKGNTNRNSMQLTVIPMQGDTPTQQLHSHYNVKINT